MQSELRAALADDLDQFIRLHDCELDVATLAALKAADFPNGLALQPAGEAGELACANMAAAVHGETSLDDLAADYAAIYLNNSLGASPYESVWLSDDHLACAAPMFELRDIYAEVGLKAADWRSRFDDHFVLQLQYLRRVLASSASMETTAGPGGAGLTVNPEKLANFNDEHIGYWFPDFAQRVSMQCSTPFYAALAELTHVWLIRFRELLDDLYDLPIPEREQMSQRINRKLAMEKAEVSPIRFMPGAQGPSW